MAVYAEPVVQQVAAVVLNSCYSLVDWMTERVCAAIERLESLRERQPRQTISPQFSRTRWMLWFGLPTLLMLTFVSLR